ncbi:thiamine biosynthesis lipoprotein ApbE [Clostridia bacterium]|nr:thiamine biosynthesis lipoprotein ApbE [Clostridia bacterium]
MRKAAACLIVFAVIVGCTACAPTPKLITATAFDFMDTFSTVTLLEKDAALSEHIFDICRELNSLADKHDSASEIARLNAAQGESVRISPDIETLLRIGKEAASMSGGLLDITIGGVSGLWDWNSPLNQIPDADELAEAVQHVGIDSLSVGNGYASVANGAAIDLGALAKGYALDLIRNYLDSTDLTSAMINLGGSVLAYGNRPDGKPWRVGIQRPFNTDGGLVGVLEVTNQCVVTAGVYERSFELDGILYHHILNPHTGMPIQTDVLGVTIVTDNGAWADAYSTMCVLFGSKEALEFINSLENVECVLALSDGTILTSDGIGGRIPFTEGK